MKRPKLKKELEKLQEVGFIEEKEASLLEQRHVEQDLACSMYHRQAMDMYWPYSAGNWTGD